MAEIIRYVDPNSAGGNGTTTDLAGANAAYASLSAWEAAEDTDLTDGGGDWMHVYCRTNGATTVDTAYVLILGWVTAAANYILIETHADDKHSGVWDETKYYLHNNDSASSIIIIQTDYVRINGLQIKVTATGANNRFGINVQIVAAGGYIKVEKCILKGVDSSTGAVLGITCSDVDADLDVFNCIVYDFINGEDTSHYGIRTTFVDVLNIFNCTVYNCYYGIATTGTLDTVKNSVVFNCTDDFLGVTTVDYCASDDNEGTNAQDLNENAGGEWAAAFTNYAAGNFSVKDASSLLYNNGTDLSGVGVTDDIIGTARPQAITYDIGAFEYVAAGGPEWKDIWMGSVSQQYFNMMRG